MGYTELRQQWHQRLGVKVGDPLPPGWKWGPENEYGEPSVIQPPKTYSRVMPEAQAKALGWHGPVYHGTTSARAASIRQRGFYMPRSESYELDDWGTIEEIAGGETVVIWFGEKPGDVKGYGDGSIVVAYLRPGGFREAGTFFGERALVVDDVNNVVAVSDVKTAGLHVEASAHADIVGDLSHLTPENARKVRDQVAKLPDDVAAIFSRHGVKVESRDKVLNGERGRLDYGGLYDSATKSVLVSNKGFGDDAATSIEGGAPFILHELAHALDHLSGWTSMTPEFKSVHKDAKPTGLYFSKAYGGSNPRRELLAESFAHHWNGTKPDPDKHFTQTEYLQQLADGLRHNVHTGDSL